MITRKHHLFNKVGECISIRGPSIGLSFDEHINGHSCQSQGQDGHCWWFCDYNLVRCTVTTAVLGKGEIIMDLPEQKL